MKFTAIDFETANSSRSSACAVGLAIVDDGEIVDQVYQLIRPEPLLFDPFNVTIHRITETDVAEAPSFAEFWPDLVGSVCGPLVAHNASFDMSVLRQALDKSDIPYPSADYFCTRVIAKLTWPQHPTYALDHIAQSLEIQFRHHDAAEDARACAIIALRACETHGVLSLYDLQESCGLRVGSLFNGGYAPCGGPTGAGSRGARVERIRTVDTSPAANGGDPSHPFSRKSFAFTGAMTAMQRRAAMEAVADRGGVCHDTVRQDTDFLVLGQKGYIGYRSGHRSSKMNKAEEMLREGLPIEILSEADFVSML